METPRLIAITGRAQHGKDTVGNYLAEHFGYEKMAFATALKNMAMVLNPIVAEEFYKKDDGGFAIKERRLAEWVDGLGWEDAKTWPEVRRFLQVLGTEAVRNILGEDSWVAALDKAYHEAGRPRTVITDCRFPNEADWVRSNKGVIWRVKRVSRTFVPGNIQAGEVEVPFDNGLRSEDGGDHPSEAHVDSMRVNKELVAYDVPSLEKKVENYIRFIRLQNKIGGV